MPTETIHENRSSTTARAATRNVDLMAEELAVLGRVSSEVQSMVLDEELTHAAEVLAAQEMAYAAVPRTYYRRGEDLIDKHNQSLRRVLEDGIEYSQKEKRLGIPGADWEFERRQAELKNLETIIAMPPGYACIEISALPYDKPKKEQLAQHYNGLTVVRGSIKDKYEPDKITQFNYVIAVTNPEFLQAVQTSLGRGQEQHIINSDELLKNPIIQEVNQPAEAYARQIDGLIGGALLHTAFGQSAVRMLHKAITNRREAWEFVNSTSQADMHNELLAAMIQAAKLMPNDREHVILAIRSGFWKEFKDRFNDRRTTAAEGQVIAAAASRAVADGDIFIACGSTVVATELGNQINPAQMVESLRHEVVGSGGCAACRTTGKLYGCGLCFGCNKKWCDIYETSGRQTDIKNLAHLNYSRPSKSFLDTMSESLAEQWERIGREIEAKKRTRKLQKP